MKPLRGEQSGINDPGGDGMLVSASNFRGPYLGCIDASDSESRLIFQHFSRSTRLTYFCTAPNSTIQLKFVKLFMKFKNENSIFNFAKSWTKFSYFLSLERCISIENLVDREKC